MEYLTLKFNQVLMHHIELLSKLDCLAIVQ